MLNFTYKNLRNYFLNSIDLSVKVFLTDITEIYHYLYSPKKKCNHYLTNLLSLIHFSFSFFLFFNFRIEFKVQDNAHRIKYMICHIQVYSYLFYQNKKFTYTSHKTSTFIKNKNKKKKFGKHLRTARIHDHHRHHNISIIIIHQKKHIYHRHPTEQQSFKFLSIHALWAHPQKSLLFKRKNCYPIVVYTYFDMEG